MRITPIKNLYFQSRKTDLKEADKISRKSKTLFPVISYTKYETLGNKDIFEHKKPSKLTQGITDRRNSTRKKQRDMHDMGYNMAVSTVIPILKSLQKSPYGNCSETTASVFGLLCADGYLNSRMASLYNEAIVKDKKTGEIKAKIDGRVDHSAVMTSMKKENEFNEDTCDIVIDPWADVVASKQDAYLRYETIFKDKIQDMEEQAFKKVKLNYIEMEGNLKGFDPDDYEITSKLHFEVRYNYGDREVKSLQNYMHSFFEDIL